MNIEKLRNHCLAVKDAEECTPFGEDVLVYKVMNKMFAFFSLNPKDNEHFVVLKCDPEKTVQLREKYAGVTKGYCIDDFGIVNSQFRRCKALAINPLLHNKDISKAYPYSARAKILLSGGPEKMPENRGGYPPREVPKIAQSTKVPL